MRKVVAILCLYLFLSFSGCFAPENFYEKYDLKSLTHKCQLENKFLVIIAGTENCRFCNFFYRILETSETFKKTITDRFLFTRLNMSDEPALAQILGITTTPTVLIVDGEFSVKYVHSGLLVASEWQQVLDEVVNGGKVFTLQQSHFYSGGEKLYSLYSKVLQAYVLLDKLRVMEIEYRQAIRLLEESVGIEPYFMNRYLLMSAYIAVGEKPYADRLYDELASENYDYQPVLYESLIGPVVERKYVDVPENKKAVFHTATEIVDLGEIKKGETTEAVIKFTNEGDTPLIIAKVDASCGCIKSDWDRKPVLKNKEGQIRLKYYTENQGYLFKRVMIFSNAVKSPVAIVLKGTIK